MIVFWGGGGTGTLFTYSPFPSCIRSFFLDTGIRSILVELLIELYAVYSKYQVGFMMFYGMYVASCLFVVQLKKETGKKIKTIFVF